MFRIIPFFLHIALCVVMTPAVCRCVSGAARLFRQLCSDENSCRLIGCFAYILISADAPIREPYYAWIQGGLTFHAAKLCALLAAQKMLDGGLLNV